MSAVKAGLGVIIPLAPLHCFTWEELEERIIGRPDIDVDLLMEHTVYDPKVCFFIFFFITLTPLYFFVCFLPFFLYLNLFLFPSKKK